MVYFFFFSAKKDLSQLWSALESIREEVTSLEMANDEMKILCDYAKETSENNSKLKEATESIIKLKSEVKNCPRTNENSNQSVMNMNMITSQSNIL